MSQYHVSHQPTRYHFQFNVFHIGMCEELPVVNGICFVTAWFPVQYSNYISLNYVTHFIEIHMFVTGRYIVICYVHHNAVFTLLYICIRKHMYNIYVYVHSINIVGIDFSKSRYSMKVDDVYLSSVKWVLLLSKPFLNGYERGHIGVKVCKLITGPS